MHLELTILYFIIDFFILIESLSTHPKLLLISFDGFRYDLLTEKLVPNIYKFAKSGTWFKSGLKSQYVTITAPNHMSIATGMYQESHGIVGNYFYDPDLDQFFDYFNDTDHPKAVNSSEWYKSDPIWLTNERMDKSRRSASIYWPNGESPFPFLPHKPSFYKLAPTQQLSSEYVSIL